MNHLINLFNTNFSLVYIVNKSDKLVNNLLVLIVLYFKLSLMSLIL
mgnify:CR=1 FL=1